MKKRLAIIGSAGVPGKYGGFETMVDQILPELSKNYQITVYCSGKLYRGTDRIKEYKGARLVYLPFSANGAQSIIYDLISLFLSVWKHQYILALGVSGGIGFPFVKWFTNRKLVVNIDGLEWRRAKWGPMIRSFLKFSERLAVRYSHADVTDNMGIKRYTSRHYKTLSYLIAYGGDHVQQVPVKNQDRFKYTFLNELYAFKVARIEPENNIHMVLGAFAQNGKRRLVVVGNWKNSEYGRGLLEKYGAIKNLTLLDPIYDSAELNLLRSNCHVYIHGHSAGGTNPSLVEAMYLGLPVLSFDVSFNRFTTHNKAIYFKNQKMLFDLIESLKYSELMTCKKAMRSIAIQVYTWEIIAKKYHHLFTSFSYNYTKPKLTRDWTDKSWKFKQMNGFQHLSKTKFYYENK